MKLRVSLILVAWLFSAILAEDGEATSFHILGPPGYSESIQVKALAADQREVGQWTLALPFSGALDLPTTLLPLRLEVSGNGLLACDVFLPTQEAAITDVRLELRASTSITGKIIGLAAEPAPPSEIRLEVKPAKVSDKEASRPRICQQESWQITCQVSQGNFQCPAPVGIFDLRVESGPMVPAYFWRMEIRPDSKTNLPDISWVKGASIAGFVVHPERGGILPETITARVEAEGQQGTEAQRAAFEGLRREVKVTESSGFFQFRGVPLGRYRLETRRQELEAVSESLIVSEPEEVFLEDPLLLQKLPELLVYIDPPLDSTGAPWTLRLLETQGYRRRIVAEQPTTKEGATRLGGFSAGEYRLEAEAVGGSIFYSEDIQVSPGSNSLFLEIAQVGVRGNLTAGGKKLVGRVVFGANRRPRIVLETDDEGYFEGHLPRAGKWPILVEWDEASARHLPPVTVEKTRPKDFFEVNIELPGGSISGKVFRHDKPVPATVVLSRTDNPATSASGPTYALADSEGKFRLLGMDPGAYEVFAFLGQHKSSPIPIQLANEQVIEEVKIELGSSKQIEGRVVNFGRGVPGATVFWRSSSENVWSFRTSTDADGKFTIEAQNNQTAVDLWVLASDGRQWIGRERIVWPQGESVVRLPEITVGSTGSLILHFSQLDGFELRKGEVAIPLRMVLSVLLSEGLAEFRHEDGALQLPSFPVGFWQLCPLAGATSNCEGALLQAGIPLELGQPETKPAPVDP